MSSEEVNVEVTPESPTKVTKRGKKTEDSLPPESNATIGEDVSSDDILKLGVFQLSHYANVPAFQTESSACFDLQAFIPEGTQVKVVNQYGNMNSRTVDSNGLTLHINERALIPTGLIFDIPEGYCLEIYPRSGISFKNGISLSNCTAIIDSDYVDQLYISATNIGIVSYTIANGDRIAQAKLVKLVDTTIQTLTKAPQQKTSRSGGFGSTGN